MFVLKSTYEALELNYLTTARELAALRNAWNKLVTQVNKKGGEDFLKHGVLIRPVAPQFSQDEIRTLIKLCHPDKHDGSEEATAITAKLLEMRK